MTGTTFADIVAGRAPAHTVDENARALAFLDAAPATRGHTLVVPKAPAADLFDVAEEDLAAVARLAKRVAAHIERAFRPAGLNLVHSSRAAAGQEVGYVHLHVIPRYDGDGVRLAWAGGGDDELASVARRLRTALP